MASNQGGETGPTTMPTVPISTTERTMKSNVATKAGTGEGTLTVTRRVS